MRSGRWMGALVLAGTLAAAAGAEVYVYPGKGQSREQQAKDAAECASWARSQTGFDPAAAGGGGAPPAGGAVRGAARGAAVGAVGGAIGGNAGKGAAIGAGVGAVGGGIRRHRAQAAQQQQFAANRAGYDRAFAACMSGRGYTAR